MYGSDSDDNYQYEVDCDSQYGITHDFDNKHIGYDHDCDYD